MRGTRLILINFLHHCVTVLDDNANDSKRVFIAVLIDTVCINRQSTPELPDLPRANSYFIKVWNDSCFFTGIS